jgi:siderophore synthetase component
MPKQFAIKASDKTIEKILNNLPYETTERFVKMTIEDAKTEGTSAYFVTNVKYRNQTYPFMIYSHQNFLDEFASMPPGIDEYFVPVTQIKD